MVWHPSRSTQAEADQRILHCTHWTSLFPAEIYQRVSETLAHPVVELGYRIVGLAIQEAGPSGFEQPIVLRLHP